MIQFGNKEAASITIGGKEVQKIEIGGKTAYEKVSVDYLYIENTYAGTNTVSIGTSSSGTPSSSYYSTTVEYSKDKVNWNTLTLATGTLENPFTITLNAGEKLYFRNDNGKFNYEDNGNWLTRIFASESNVVGGNIMTLLNYKNISGTALIPGCFAYLFRNNNTMTSASNLTLPSSIINRCYIYSFSNCTALTSPPVLPATTTANNCYSYMFDGDSSLTKTPVLLATTVESNAYRRMFRNCSSLNEVTNYANSVLSNGTEDWLSNVSSTGTFHNLGSATYTTSSASGIPTGWTEDTSNRFVFTNTVITDVGNNQAELTSDIQVNYTGTWDDAYFEVYNELDKNRSIHFSPSDISNGVLTASNLITESNVATLVSPATVTIYNSGTAVWTGSVSFTVVQ